MNKDTFIGDWNQLKGKIKEEWGKLTEDDLIEINGRKDQLLGKLQKKYGCAKEKAEQMIQSWEKRQGSSFSSKAEDLLSSGKEKFDKFTHKR